MKIQAKGRGTFFTSVGVEIVLVFLGLHMSTMQVENLCYVLAHQFSKKSLAYLLYLNFVTK
jgi:hypothetical protein